MNVILNQFINRVQIATKARSKELKMTLEESQAVVSEITKLIARDSSVLDEIVNMMNNGQLTRVPKANPTTNERVVISGGRFSDKDDEQN